MNKEEFRNDLKSRGYEKISPLKAIKQFCYECSGESFNEVRLCTSKICALYPFRLGFNPFTERDYSPTDEQRQAAADRLRKYHKNKNNEGENNNVEEEC